MEPIKKILEGASAWNHWRSANPYIRADLNGADLNGADLNGANLSGANLSGANLRDADLRDADLRDADLRDADLSGAYLSGADLSGAYLSGAYLSGADLSGANLSKWLGSGSCRWPWVAFLTAEGEIYLSVGCQSGLLSSWEKRRDALIELYPKDEQWVSALIDFVKRLAADEVP